MDFKTALEKEADAEMHTDSDAARFQDQLKAQRRNNPVNFGMEDYVDFNSLIDESNFNDCFELIINIKII